MKASINLLTRLVTVALGLGACQKEIDSPHEGLFVIANQSGYDVLLTVFNRQDRRQAPLTVAIPNNSHVERPASGNFGGFAYPELFFQGDSVVLAFSDGKRLRHYCSQAQQLRHTCAPTHNVLDLYQYQTESSSQNKTRYTFTLTSTDYDSAQ